MHVENELVEFVTAGEQEYEEVIEEYEVEILILEEVPRPTGHSLVTLFSLSVLVKDRPLH